MVRLLLLSVIMLTLSGCLGGKLTSYDLKASVGNTEYDNGEHAFYTGGSAGFHFDVK